MTPSQNSSIAYAAIPNLLWRQQKVLKTIRNCPGASSADVARIAHMEPHNVRCRITELLNAGEIEIVGEKIDRITHRRVRQYKATGRE